MSGQTPISDSLGFREQFQTLLAPAPAFLSADQGLAVDADLLTRDIAVEPAVEKPEGRPAFLVPVEQPGARPL